MMSVVRSDQMLLAAILQASRTTSIDLTDEKTICYCHRCGVTTLSISCERGCGRTDNVWAGVQMLDTRLSSACTLGNVLFDWPYTAIGYSYSS